MAYNGFYRQKTITIKKYDGDGNLETGYPHTYSMTDAAFVYPSGVITDQVISDMQDGSIGESGTWQDLLFEFKKWVEGQEELLSIQEAQTSNPTGYDSVTCPVDEGDYY